MPNAFALFGEINVNADKAVTALKRTETAAKTTTTALSKTEQAAVKAGNNASRGIDRMRTSTAAAAKSASSLGSIWGAITGGAIATGIGFAVKTATSFDSLTRALTAVTGSSATAATQLVRLKEVAKSPGLSFKEAIQGSVNLQAAGLSADTAERALMAFGNALATVGKGKAELDGVITALSQIQSKGKISAEEINQMAERLPQIRVAMQAAFGTSNTEALEKMGITSKQFIEKVIGEFEKLPKVVGGARNSFDNFSDAVEKAMVPIGDAILNKITPAMDELAAELQKDRPNLHAASSTLGENIGKWINQGLRDASKGDEGDSPLIDWVKKWTKDSGLVGPIIRGALKDAGFTPDFSGFYAALNKAGEALNQWVGRGMITIVSGLKEWSGRILVASVTMGTQLSMMGLKLAHNIAQGFIDGLRAKAGEAAAAVRNFFSQNVTAKAEGTLEVQSPSKVFFRIGKDVAQGFIDGIAAMKTGVHAAMAGLFDISGQSLGKKDAAGVSLLTELIGELDNLAPRTKLQEVQAQLTAGAYANLNNYVKNGILLAAKKIDAINAEAKAMDALISRYTSFQNVQDSGDTGQPGRAPTSLAPTGLGGMFLEDGGVNPFEKFLAPPPQLRQAWDSFWDTMNERLNYWKSTLPSMKQAIGENLINSIYAIGDVFGNAVANWDGTAKGFFKSLAQGFKQMVGQIIGELVRLMVIKAIMNLIGGAFGGSLGGLFGGAASSGVAGAGNSVGGLMGGGGGYMFASGGMVNGKGSGTSDSILARLSNGEFVMSAASVRKWGAGFFEGLNSMTGPALGFAGGGMVGGGATYNQQSYSTSPTINVYMPQGGNGNLTKGQITNAVITALHKSEHRNR